MFGNVTRARPAEVLTCVGCGTLFAVALAPRPRSLRTLKPLSPRTLTGVAGLLSVATLVLGCGDDGPSNRVKLTESLGCSTSYVAKSSDVLGVEDLGECQFRGASISIVTFVDNGSRNNYVCSTCAFNADTEARAIESTARGLGGRFVAGERFLIGVPDWASEQAVREALG